MSVSGSSPNKEPDVTSQENASRYLDQQPNHLKLSGRYLVVSGKQLAHRELSISEKIQALFNCGPASQKAVNTFCMQNKIIRRQIESPDFAKKTAEFKQNPAMDLSAVPQYYLRARNKEGNSWLHIACEQNNGNAIKALLEKAPAIADMPGKDNLTALQMAVAYNKPEALKALIDARPYSTYPAPYVDALQLACELGHHEIVKIMIERAPEALNKPGNNNQTALHVASKKGRYDIVEILIQKGAEANALDKQGKTALWYALCQGHTDVANMITVNGGYEPNTQERLLLNNLNFRRSPPTSS